VAVSFIGGRKILSYFFTLLFSELIITMALQYILAVGMHMAVAKELLTFCLEPHCKCDPVNEDATCSGLDFVPNHMLHFAKIVRLR
jgi:hypothetical protein